MKFLESVRHSPARVSDEQTGPDSNTGQRFQLGSWFFENHAHCTKYARSISGVAVICASVIQGYVLGPASYVVTAADLHPVHERNCIFKYADDSYLIVPAVNTDTCQEEIDSLSA